LARPLGVPLYLEEGDKARFHFLEVDGATVVVDLSATTPDFDELVGEGDKPLETVRFES
jgi:hypothetical protein